MSFISGWRLTVVFVFLAIAAGFWFLLAGYNLRWEFTLIPLFFAVQVVLADFVEHYLLNYVGLRGRWFSIVMAPGTILHELSHLLAALFTGCTITDVVFFKFDRRSNTLGHVEFLQPRDSWIVLRSFLTAFSPFFACGILLLIFNYLVVWNTLVLDVFSSAETVFDNVSAMVLSYYNTSMNPILLALLTYLSVCFALGAAPSMQDIKIFFWSLPKHPISSLFFIGLLFALVNLGEVQLDLLGYMLSDIMVFVFDLIVYVQLMSIAVLVASIPLLLVSDKFVELRMEKRVLVSLAAIIVYVSLKVLLNLSGKTSVVAAAAVFLVLLVLFRWPRAFLKSSRPSASRS